MGKKKNTKLLPFTAPYSPFAIRYSPLLNPVQLSRIQLEDIPVVGFAQKVEALDEGLEVVHRAVGARIDRRAGAGALGPEHAIVRADDLEQQLQRFRGIEACIVMQLLRHVLEILA